MYWEGSGKIYKLKNNLLQRSLIPKPNMILIIFFCNLKIFALFEECPLCITSIIHFTCIRKAPIIFADDTSILFEQSNLTDIKKNIYVLFTTLNKWLRANQLDLNFNKTNYVHFATKRYTSVNLKIGFKYNFTTNSSYTKFLGVTMNNLLSWNNHIDLIIKKVSKACYIIRNASSLK